jgi:hypothetical protein
MRTAFAISASSLLILAAIIEGTLLWWLVGAGLVCIWALKVKVEQERRDDVQRARSEGNRETLRAIREAVDQPPSDQVGP